MTSPSTTISLRLPQETKERLERAAAAQRRSQSFIVKEALDQYLERFANLTPEDRAERLRRLLAFEGVGARDGGRTAEDIDAQVRAFRDNE